MSPVLVRYSSVIETVYGIALPREKLSLVDAHFIAAAHHHYRSHIDDVALSRYHSRLCWRHVFSFMVIVKHGDFSRACDKTKRGLDRPTGWEPIGIASFPDTSMFGYYASDYSYTVGMPHPYDELLDPKRVQTALAGLEITSFSA